LPCDVEDRDVQPSTFLKHAKRGLAFDIDTRLQICGHFLKHLYRSPQGVRRHVELRAGFFNNSEKDDRALKEALDLLRGA